MSRFEDWLKNSCNALFDSIKNEVESTRADMTFNPSKFSVEGLAAMKQNINSLIDRVAKKLDENKAESDGVSLDHPNQPSPPVLSENATQTEQSAPTFSPVLSESVIFFDESTHVRKTPLDLAGLDDMNDNRKSSEIQETALGDVDFSEGFIGRTPLNFDGSDENDGNGSNNSGSSGNQVTAPTETSGTTRLTDNTKNVRISVKDAILPEEQESEVADGGDLNGPPTVRQPRHNSKTAKVFANKEQFVLALKKHSFGQRRFVKFLAANEEKFFNNREVEFIVHNNGDDFHKAVNELDEFNRVHLIKRAEGLGIKVPNLTFLNIEKLLEEGPATFSVINSQSRKTQAMSLGDMMRHMNAENEAGGRPTDPYNLLSFEFSRYSTIDSKFEVPDYVSRNNMKKKLKMALDTVPLQSDNSLASSSEDRKDSLNMEDIQKELPNIEKYLIISTAGCLTDMHVDFSGSAVFYHVIHGRKIFYVVSPTEENLEIYETVENKRAQNIDDDWAGLTFMDQWTRIVVNAGETAFIPAGVIHFVYTPEKSIVFGGNYFSFNQLAMHFKISKTEFERVKSKKMHRKYSVQEFYPFMASYGKFVLLDQIRNSSGEQLQQLKETAKLFFTNLKDETASQSKKKWRKFFEEVVNEFGEVLGISTTAGTLSSKRPASSEEPDDVKRSKL